MGAAIHAASRYLRPGMVPRGLAWVVWAGGAALSGPLARPAVLGALAAAGLLDLAFHAGHDEPEREPGSRKVATAIAAAGLALAVALAVVRLVPAAGEAARLTATALAAGGLAVAYALRPRVRTPGRLLAGALAFAVVFRGLAAPVLPLGPILAYWVLVGAAGLALVAGTRSVVGEGVPPGIERHRQRVEIRPDPLDRGLESALRSYLDGAATPRRVRRAVARHDADLADDVAAALPDPDAPETERARAVSESLDVPLEEDP